MEKKINKFIKKIEIKKNVFDSLNNLIEEKCINSSILLLVDFITIKNFETELLKIKDNSLNNIVIKVLNSCELNEKGEKKINQILNETFDMIVGIGEFNLLKFTESIAIKTNICYGFVNLFEIKSELFCENNLILIQNIDYYPPYFILIKDKEYSLEEIFKAKLNIFKYYYLFLEYYIDINKNIDIKNFLTEYKKIITSVKDENILEKIIALGLILNKNKIKYFIDSNNYSNEFEKFLSSSIMISTYQSIFNQMNYNNLIFSRAYKNDKKSIYKFENFDFEFYKFYLLSMKNNIKIIINNLNSFFIYCCENLKNTNFKLFYENCKYININKILENIEKNKDKLFITILENFDIFNFQF